MNESRLGLAIRIVTTLVLGGVFVISALPGFALAGTQGPPTYIVVSPQTTTVTSGRSQLFTATGYDANNNPVAGLTFTWSLTDPVAGTINSSTGVFTAGTAGGIYSNVIQANWAGIVGKATVTVVGPLTNFTIYPPNASVRLNETLAFAAIGVDQYGRPRTGDTFTWGVNPAAGSIGATTGIFTAGGTPGNYNLWASSGGITRSVGVAVVLETNPARLRWWGSGGNGNGQFNSSEDIAVDGWGNVYVVDQGNSRIQKFDSFGVFLLKWGSWGVLEGQFSSDMGDLAVDSAGNVYVVDSGNRRVQKFDGNGNYLLEWGSLGTADGQFSSPHGIAVDSSNNVFVGDTSSNRIQVFTSMGTFLRKWGTQGTGDGQFTSLGPIAVDSSGNVYAGDSMVSRVQKFSNSGQYALKWDSYYGASDIATDGAGNVYVATYYPSVEEVTAIRKYSSSGGLRFQMGGMYHNFYAGTPVGIALDSQSRCQWRRRG